MQQFLPNLYNCNSVGLNNMSEGTELWTILKAFFDNSQRCLMVLKMRLNEVHLCRPDFIYLLHFNH